MKTLKLFSLFFVVTIISAMLAGCSSNDDENDNYSNEAINLVGGTWVYLEDEEVYEKIEFYSDGTCLYQEFENGELSDKGYGKYSIKGDKLVMILTFGDETEKWTYAIDTEAFDEGKLLVLIDEDGDIYYFHNWSN